MKIQTGDDLHTAIRKVCAGSTRAGSIIVLLQREFPENTLDYLKVIDSRGLYGKELADFFFGTCGADVDQFLRRITDG